MNLLAILSQLILLWLSYSSVQGDDNVEICDIIEVKLPSWDPAIYKSVKLWKNNRTNYYHFTKASANATGSDFKIKKTSMYKLFLINEIYSMVGKFVWLKVSGEVHCLVLTFESVESAQQFYIQHDRHPPVYHNNFPLNEMRIVHQSLLNVPITITKSLAIDVFKDNPDSMIGKIFIHKTDDDQAPYCIFYSTEFTMHLGQNHVNSLSFLVTPETEDGLSLMVDVDFVDNDTRKYFMNFRKNSVPNPAEFQNDWEDY